MNNSNIDAILKQIRQGKRCYCGVESEELSTSISIEQGSDGLYSYRASTTHQYDVMAPAHYDNRRLSEDELRALLNTLPEEVFQNISYVDTVVINETTRPNAELIYSYLRQRPKTAYVVFKEDRHSKRDGESLMNFNSLHKTAEQAGQMVDYLRGKQGVKAYWKAVTLVLAGEEIRLEGELSSFENLNSRQIFITLLMMKPQELTEFL